MITETITNVVDGKLKECEYIYIYIYIYIKKSKIQNIASINLMTIHISNKGRILRKS